jgi:hypothetical protein
MDDLEAGFGAAGDELIESEGLHRPERSSPLQFARQRPLGTPCE